jgi:fatty-acyl-CoA synthase
MQNWPLTVDRIVTHAKTWRGGREIVTRSVEGLIVRTTYAELHERALRLTGALRALGVASGTRVATLAWNTARHMEAWYAVMGMGAVCHTLIPRLFIDQLHYIINHAQDRIIFTDLSFLPALMDLRAKMPSVERKPGLRPPQGRACGGDRRPPPEVGRAPAARRRDSAG